ncbi:rotamase, partial [Burkholderia pseudomallei]
GSGRNNIGTLNADASESASGAAAADGQDDAEKSRALERALILAHAKSSGMQSRPDVDRALHVAHETTLIDAYIDDFFSAVSVDDDDIGAAYARITSK